MYGPLHLPSLQDTWNACSRYRIPPNLQVNEHYVKPLTLAAGGMSYALMNL